MPGTVKSEPSPDAVRSVNKRCFEIGKTEFVLGYFPLDKGHFITGLSRLPSFVRLNPPALTSGIEAAKMSQDDFNA